MSIPIVIAGTPIDFPASAASPNWSPSVIDFAKAVESALSTIVGPYDIASQVYVMTSNSNSNIDIPNLSFPTGNVRGAFIRYTVFRTTTTNNAYEIGELKVVYNPNNPVTQKWEITRDYTGDGEVTFTITDTGQIQFSSIALSGANHVGHISFVAQALLQLP